MYQAQPPQEEGENEQSEGQTFMRRAWMIMSGLFSENQLAALDPPSPIPNTMDWNDPNVEKDQPPGLGSGQQIGRLTHAVSAALAEINPNPPAPFAFTPADHPFRQVNIPVPPMLMRFDWADPDS